MPCCVVQISCTPLYPATKPAAGEPIPVAPVEHVQLFKVRYSRQKKWRTEPALGRAEHACRQAASRSSCGSSALVSACLILCCTSVAQLLGGGGVRGRDSLGVCSLGGVRIPSGAGGYYTKGGGARQAMDGLWTEACGQQKQSNNPRNNQHKPQYANYLAPLTRKRHIPPHPAQPRHTNYWAPRTRKRHQQEHRPQRPTERSDPTQHAKGRPGDRPGPRKETTTRRNVTRGVKVHGRTQLSSVAMRCHTQVF